MLNGISQICGLSFICGVFILCHFAVYFSAIQVFIGYWIMGVLKLSVVPSLYLFLGSL